MSSAYASSAAHRSAPPAATPSRIPPAPHHRYLHSAPALQHFSSRVLAPSASRPHRSCRGPRISSSWRNQLRPRLPASAASASAPPPRCHRFGLCIATSSAAFTVGVCMRLAGSAPQQSATLARPLHQRTRQYLHGVALTITPQHFRQPQCSNQLLPSPPRGVFLAPPACLRSPAIILCRSHAWQVHFAGTRCRYACRPRSSLAAAFVARARPRQLFHLHQH
jgi:hypothetical protein